PGYDREAGTFQAWLWGVIRNRVRSIRRKDQKEEPAAPVGHGDSEDGKCKKMPQTVELPTDTEKAEIGDWQRAILAAALQKMRERVTPQNFTIYISLLHEKATVRALAEKYKVKPNAIYQAKKRCEEILLHESKALLQAWDHL